MRAETKPIFMSSDEAQKFWHRNGGVLLEKPDSIIRDENAPDSYWAEFKIISPACNDCYEKEGAD